VDLINVIDVWVENKIELLQQRRAEEQEIINRQWSDRGESNPFPKVGSTITLILDSKIEALKELQDFYKRYPTKLS